jgi:hypothetical protein
MWAMAAGDTWRCEFGGDLLILRFSWSYISTVSSS